MGKKDKEHKKKVAQRNARLGIGNPIARTAVSFASRGQVVSELRKAGTDDQIDVLNRTVVSQQPSKLRKAIMDKAPKEMDKAIKTLQKQGKEVTVDSLTFESKSTPSFVQMCSDIGIEMSWFEELARKRMEAHGL
jgi:hypothetical protein